MGTPTHRPAPHPCGVTRDLRCSAGTAGSTRSSRRPRRRHPGARHDRRSPGRGDAAQQRGEVPCARGVCRDPEHLPEESAGMPTRPLPPPSSPATGVQAGLLVASAVVPGTFAPSLSDRGAADQGVVTGLSTGIHYLLTVATQDILQAVAAELAAALPV